MPNFIKPISGREFPENVIPLIEASKISIDVVVFDWRWYSHDAGCACQLFNQTIIRAARRGVKIRAIANNNFILKVLKDNGIDSKLLDTSKLVHCKLMIIDGKIAITGSHNYTQSAFTKNLEFSVIIGEEISKEPYINFFNSLWKLY